jgi:hypothetical protein
MLLTAVVRHRRRVWSGQTQLRDRRGDRPGDAPGDLCGRDRRPCERVVSTADSRRLRDELWQRGARLPLRRYLVDDEDGVELDPAVADQLEAP